ncbi:MAG: AAA family ATPase [Candidatus Helarchaeota archaeon]
MIKDIKIDYKFRGRIEKIINSLNKGLIEREEVVKLAFISGIAGENIFMLGPPGVAKSLIARRLKFAFKNAKSFDYLMHRFSTPDEVFGPISVEKLKNENKLERMTEHYLPGANIVFLDEIWKAGPSIQNTLLTIINEKIFRNGEQEFKVDIFGLLAASNELPEKGVGLDALWDRFLVRVMVDNIINRENFEKMITDTSDPYVDNINNDLKITKEEYYQWQKERDKIKVGKDILDVIHIIRVKIQEYNDKILKTRDENEEGDERDIIYISDRRWKKIIKVLRTSAFLNGRSFVDLMDCFLIPYMIWSEPDQFEIASSIVKEAIRLSGYLIGTDLTLINKKIQELIKEVEDQTTYITYTHAVATKKFDGKEYAKITPNFYNCKYIDYNEFKSMKEGATYSIKFISTNKSLTARILKRDEYSFKIDDYSYSKSIHNIVLIENGTKEYRGKPPTERLIRLWDEEINKINEELDKNLELIDRYVNSNLKFLKENIFVDTSLSEVVLDRINEMKVKIEESKLKIKELQDYYKSLEEGRIYKTEIIVDESEENEDED